MIRLLTPLALLLALLAWWSPARAATSCVVTTTPTLAFGTVTGTAQVTTNTSVTVTCTTTGLQLLSSVKMAVCIGIGTATGDSLATWRRMANTTGQTLDYQVYGNAALTSVVGTNSTTSPTWLLANFTYATVLSGSSTGSTTFTLYGRYPTGQTMAFGSFSRALPVTMQYAASEPTILGLGPNVPNCTTTGTGITNSGLIGNAGTLTTTANVAASCGTYLVPTPAFSFGTNVGRVTTNIDQQATLGLTCVNQTPWQIGLNNGANADGSGNRRMIRTIGSTNYYVPYELYKDSGRSTRWGNTLNSTTLSGTGTGAAQTIPIYGRVPPTTGPGTAPGTYSDTIQVTITY